MSPFAPSPLFLQIFFIYSQLNIFQGKLLTKFLFINSSASLRIIRNYIKSCYFSRHFRGKAFVIKQTAVDPKFQATVGNTITLTCQSDGYFEYCDWEHQDKVCKFEWKRWHWAVRKQTCPELSSRMNYVGNYKSHECKVELTDVELADAGKWQCTVEGYGFWTRGDIVSAELNLDVVKEKKQEATVKPITTTVTLTSTDNTELETKTDLPEGNSAFLWSKKVYHT